VLLGAARREARDAAEARIGTILDEAAENHADRPMIFDRPPDIDPEGPTSIDYARFAEFIAAVSGWLKAAGVEPWDRVAIFKGNHPDVLALTLACARIGAIPAQLAWTHPPAVAHELLRRLERPVLITDRARLESAGLDDATLRELTKRTIVVDGEGEEGEHVTPLAPFRGAPTPPPALRGDDEPMAIVHTSGTTGVPKLVVHSATTLGRAARYERKRIPLLRARRDDTVAICDPYFHARLLGGLAAIAAAGPKLVLMSELDESSAKPVLDEHRPTIVSTSPNAYLRWEWMTDEPSRPFKNVRLYFSTYDAIHARTVRRFLGASGHRFPVWFQALGQSEVGPVAVALHTRRSVRRHGEREPATQEFSIPVSFVGSRLRAVDPETGKPLRRGQAGLLEVRREPCVDYLGEHGRHEHKIKETWWNLGDMGVVRRTGGVRLVDREVDRTPGASCIGLEDVLLDRIPTLTETVVLGVKDGEPVPVVCTARDEPLDGDAWAEATRDLPALAEPIVVPWDDIPRTATLKVQRSKLRERVLPNSAPAGSGLWT
jgi:acyl-coenzyme A synthetase/AMP-(fatty) acid ligase